MSILFFVELVFKREQSEEFASGTVFQNEVEFFFVLEGSLEFDEERVVYVGEDGFFGHDVFLLVFFDDVFLFEYFHGVDVLIVLISH